MCTGCCAQPYNISQGRTICKMCWLRLHRALRLAAYHRALTACHACRAMYTAFLSVAVACGTPGIMAAFALGKLSNVMGCSLPDA